MNPRPEAAFFDAGDTLIHVRDSVGHIYAEAAAEYGVRADPQELDAAFRRIWETRRADPGQALPLKADDGIDYAWWREVVRDTFAAVGHGDAFDGRFEEFYAYLHGLFVTPTPWLVYPDVIPSLGALSQAGIRLAIVSNWDTRLPLLLEGLGLAKWFEVVMPSAHAGCAKPDPDIFHQILAQMGLEPGQAVHAGDREEDDVAGAIAAGVTPVLLDRHGTAVRSKALARVHDLHEFARLVLS